ncbi:MAG: hypothetical protein HQK84_04830 [Nitrospinae bacterium]|nr:hypothetical protein [Nitrospinota bacterium]
MESPTSHVKRVFILLLIIIIAGVIVRSMLIPESFGKYGHYRGNALQEEAAREVTFSEQEKCSSSECHEMNFLIKDKGKHKPVVCENCHGAFAFHPEEKRADPNKFTINRDRSLCLTCHRKEPARPKDFPMIVELEHYVEGGEKPPCISCHDPHSPSMG